MINLYILFIGISSLLQETKEYVCLPCGYDCDITIHKSPGTCPVCNMKLVEKSTIKFKNLSINEFCDRITANPKAVLLDVRTSGEFNATNTEVMSFGHFKNAININVEELEGRLSELDKYKDREVLVYCSHSHRSPRASYLLSTRGFKNVKNMTGGVSTFPQPVLNACLKENFVAHAH
jgi:rhodanese-related sulfurtransferase/DNA-directed RNA polymerase subunit RPC12/RpoP